MHVCSDPALLTAPSIFHAITSLYMDYVSESVGARQAIAVAGKVLTAERPNQDYGQPARIISAAFLHLLDYLSRLKLTGTYIFILAYTYIHT